MLNKKYFILLLAILLIMSCSTTPTISTPPFQESRSETIEKSGLSISTDHIAQKIRVKSPDVEIILPLADDWRFLSGPDKLLDSNSIKLKMKIVIYPRGSFEGSADEYVSRFVPDLLKVMRLQFPKSPISGPRIIQQGDIKIYTYRIGDQSFTVAQKAISGRILQLFVEVMGPADRAELAAIEKYVKEIIAPSFIALK